jgi:hypothetical protein
MKNIEEKRYTESEAHYLFATDFHNRTWNLLDQPVRTRDEDERMLDYAHASLAHWRVTGTAVQHERGEWMLARVYAVLGEAELSLRHALRCQELLESHIDEMEAFDFAFAPEAMARALAIAGNKPQALKYIERAQKAGEAIQDENDRDIFFKEFNGGNWNGMK